VLVTKNFALTSFAVKAVGFSFISSKSSVQAENVKRKPNAK